MADDAGILVSGGGAQTGVEASEYLILHEHLDHGYKLTKIYLLMQFTTDQLDFQIVIFVVILCRVCENSG